MDAFDADVLIYAAGAANSAGQRVRALFESAGGDVAGVGSTLLLPEILTKPLRDDSEGEALALATLLGRLELWSVDEGTAEPRCRHRRRLRPQGR